MINYKVIYIFVAENEKAAWHPQKQPWKYQLWLLSLIAQSVALRT